MKDGKLVTLVNRHRYSSRTIREVSNALCNIVEYHHPRVLEFDTKLFNSNAAESSSRMFLE